MIRKIICLNCLVVIALAAFFLLYPPVRAVLDFQDPALRQQGIPKAAWRLLRNLTPYYARWASQPLTQADPQNPSIDSSSKYPLLGSVLYLWAIENLQTQWEAGDKGAGAEPKVFAKDAIVAAADRVVDPKLAGPWKKAWGEDYLHHENVFYRTMIIAALTSRERLLHDGAHLDLLRDQVQTLASELDSSKTGLLDDTPAECHPSDVMAALVSIKRADSVLGTDHSNIIERGLRAFTGSKATRHLLPPYLANSQTALPKSDAQGASTSFICLLAPELWPAQARQWFGQYDRFFWQQRLALEGYREFPKEGPHSNWTLDTDHGPVFAGYGLPASVVAIGAARKNDRFDLAFPLSTELLGAAFELPNGVLAVPRLISHLKHAPLFGETAILWLLSIQPEKGFSARTGGAIPRIVYIGLIAVFLLGLWRVLESIVAFKQARRGPEAEVRAPFLQVGAWFCLFCGSWMMLGIGKSFLGLVMLVLAVCLPIVKKKKPPKGVEDWPGEKPTGAAPQGNEPKAL